MIHASGFGFSGFFLREDSWAKVASEFQVFQTVDHLRDQPMITLETYLDQAALALKNLPRPLVFVGHSFGGFLALALIARLNTPPEGIFLLSGLRFEPNVSPIEIYHKSFQHKVAQSSKLDMPRNTIRLTDREAFVQSAFTHDASDLSHCVVEEEPLSLVMGSISEQLPKNLRNLYYVIPEADALTPKKIQEDFAASLGATVITCPGGHASTLVNTYWLRALTHLRETR